MQPADFVPIGLSRASQRGIRIKGIIGVLPVGSTAMVGFVALSSRVPSWPNHRSERILVHAAERRVKRVARIPIVRPDWMDSVRASRDVDVVAKERALTQ